MKTTSTMPLVLTLAALVAPSCSSPQLCGLIGCENGVSVVLSKAAVKFAANLPVTLQVCVESSCRSFTIEHTGAAPVCTALGSGGTLCTIDGEGTVVLTTVPFPTGLDGGVSVPVHATVTGAMNASLFDQTEMVPLVATQPNGPNCGPGCLEAQAAFAP